MPTFRVNDILKDKILVSRESARLLEDALTSMIAEAKPPEGPTEPQPITVDFDGVEGIAPSFVDELLSVLESITQTCGDGGAARLIVANPPTRLSLKFEAIARGHGMCVRAAPDGSWVLSDAPDERP